MLQKLLTFNEAEPYEVVFGGTPEHTYATLEIPFCVKANHENSEEFTLRAERDFNLIKKFGAKEATNLGVLALEEANKIVTTLKYIVIEPNAYMQGMIGATAENAMKILGRILRKMCLENLPAGFVKGITPPPSIKRKQKAKKVNINIDDLELELIQAGYSVKNSKHCGPLIIEVPDRAK